MAKSSEPLPNHIQPAPGARAHRTWRRLPAGIWTLGFVSLLMDTSSEMIHSLLPVYLVTELGTSALAVGLIEGVAEATAAITKIFSGALSDWLGQRKWLAAAGYGLAALTKPIFPLASSFGWVVAARFIDRVGKGIRGAPRDALVADITPPGLRSASFGLRQALDTVGALLGPALAAVLMWLTVNQFRAVFWVAVVPALLSVGLITFAVREPERSKGALKARLPLSRAQLARLGAGYWWVVAIAALFTLARFSEAFLVLKAQAIGLPLMLVPGVMVVMNAVYALSAYPAGILADRVDRFKLLALGLILLIVADIVLARATGTVGLAAGVSLWGLHMGFTQGLFAALIADAAPPDLRGTAFGMFNLVTGAALLIASLVAGELWDVVGPAGTFLGGAAFSLATLAGLGRVRRVRPK